MKSKTLTCIAITLLSTSPAYAGSSDMFGDLMGDTTEELVGNVEKEGGMSNIQGFKDDPITGTKENLGAAKSLMDKGKNSGSGYSSSTSSYTSSSESKEYETDGMSKADKKIVSRINQYKSKNKKSSYGADTDTIEYVWPRPER